MELLRRLGRQVVDFPLAPFSLLRTSLESTSTAIWLTAPDDQEVRLSRRLRLQLTHLDNYCQLGHVLTPADSALLTRQRDDIRALALSLRDPVESGKSRTISVSSTEVLTAASDHMTQRFQDPRGYYTYVWRVASGFVHGRNWAPEVFLDRSSRQLIASKQPQLNVGASVETGLDPVLRTPDLRR